MKSKSKGIIVYLLLAFGVAWIPLAIQWFLGLRSLDDNATVLDYAVFILITLPTSFGPAIGTIVVRKWVTHEGFADSGLRLNVRGAWHYYLFALLYPVIVVPAILILAFLISAERPDFSALMVMSLVQMIIIAIVSTPIIWGEEFGWRGYLQVRLFAEKPLWAAVATGLIWGVWHYPMILMGYIFSGNPLGLLLYPINMIFTSIIYGWLRLRSGSVWSASLAHATGNTIINPLLASLLPSIEWPLVWAGYRLAVLVILCAWIILTGQLKQQREIAYA
ncbi:CPBP family intramembrane metalloprotease [Chloroflexi bacterium CFX6]|nr:CPBP family intramembrane metalloprotease [Chloroflexi bacterium CFX6]